MFPGVFIGWWILEALFYVLLVAGYLIYMYFIPIFVVCVVIFIIYALAKNKTKNTINKKPNIVFKQTTVTSVKEDLLHTENSLESYKKPLRDYDLTGASLEEYRVLDDGDEDEEEISELMESHDLDRDDAEHVKEIMDEEGLDEEDAVELKDLL